MAALINSAILAAGAVAHRPAFRNASGDPHDRDLFSRAGRAAAAALGVLLFLPLYVQLSGWDAALGKLGWFTLLHGSLAQAILVRHAGSDLSFMASRPCPGWHSLSALDCHRFRPRRKKRPCSSFRRGVLWRITLRQAWPFVLAAASGRRQHDIGNDGHEHLLVDPRDWTFTERFYMQMAAGDAGTGDCRRSARRCDAGARRLSTLVVAFRVAGSPSPLLHSPRPLTFHLGRWRVVASAAVWAIVLILVGVPIASLISKAGFVVVHDGAERYPTWSLVTCLHEIARVPVRFRNELLGTVAVAFARRLLPCFTGCIFAWAVRRSRWVGVLAVSVIVLGLMIPGPLVGAALIMLLNHDLPPAIPLGDGTAKSWLLILYDNTPLAPIIAQAIRALPLATLLLWYSFRYSIAMSSTPQLLTACRRACLLARRPPAALAHIVAAWIAAFAIAAGDLAWVAAGHSPGLDLLSRRVFGLGPFGRRRTSRRHFAGHHHRLFAASQRPC